MDSTTRMKRSRTSGSEKALRRSTPDLRYLALVVCILTVSWGEVAAAPWQHSTGDPGLLAGNRILPAEDEYGETTCAYKNGSSNGAHDFGVISPDPVSSEDIVFIQGRKFIKRCKYCYTLWNEQKNEVTGVTKQYIIGQGCWLTLDGCSNSPDCAMTTKPNSALNRLSAEKMPNADVKFCCCRGDKCNVNVTTDVAGGVEEKRLTDDRDVNGLVPGSYNDYYGSGGGEESNDHSLVTFLIAVILALILVTLALALILCKLYHQQKSKFSANPSSSGLKPTSERSSLEHGTSAKGELELESKAPLLISQVSSSSPSAQNDFSTLKFEEVLSKGRFGSVYKGTLGDSKKDVAVKVFNRKNAQCFLNEKSIYEMRHLNNEDNFMEYFGAQESFNLNGMQYDYLMVFSLAEHGSLAHFLKTHTLSWTQLCVMLQNISQGVSHLHSDASRRKMEHRPSVCHRDINTSNILVRSDLSCSLNDFKFSLKISGPNYYTASGGKELVCCAESSSLSEVGTVRYMAPELLEGALNLRDCESALKQVDVYAMGLTFWEVARRCKDLYQGTEVPDFSLAFQTELGHHQRSPTFEVMKILVARNKARPLFPSVWKDSNPAVQLLRETIEYCWDQDGEARLTSLCVVERIRELLTLWDRYQNKLHHPNDQSLAQKNRRRRESKEMPNNKQQQQQPSSERQLQKRNVVNSVFHNNDISSSTSPVRGGPPSPIELSPQSVPLLPHASANNRENAAGVVVGPNFSPLKIGNVLSNQKPLLKLQPHQGSNPCQERNLCPAASGSSSSSDTDGLVQRSSKDPPVPRARRDSEESVAADASGLRPLEPTFVAAPISYLQNDFSALESTGAAAGASGRSASAKNKKNEQHAKQIGKLKQSNSSSNSGASVHNVTAAPPPPHFQDLSKSNLLRARDLQAAVSQPQLRVRNEEASTLGPNININRGNETTGRNLAEDQSLSV